MNSQEEKLLRQKNSELRKKLAAKKRELQIEAALQKVWVKTMAMQRSEELAEVAVVLFQQVKELRINTWTTSFNVWL